MAEPVPHPPAPTAVQLVELAHRGTAAADGPQLLHLRLDRGAEALDLGLTPLPVDGHPADALVGFCAPDGWDAVGIATTGKVHDLGSRTAPSGRGRFTTLAFRSQPGATVIERADGRCDTIEGDPEGWAADVLRRVLGLPTAPPEGTTALLIDLWWLDALVDQVLAKRGRCRTWRAMAHAHPLCPPGRVPEPEELLALAEAEAEARPWSRLRSLLRGRDLPAAATALPHGHVASGDEWFDDGALSRWLLRATLPPDVLLTELIEHLPAHLVDQLLAGLAEVDLGAIAA